MFRFLNKIVHKEGIKVGKTLINLGMQATINDLRKNIKNRDDIIKNLQSQLDKLVIDCSNEFIKLAKENSEEIIKQAKIHSSEIISQAKEHTKDIKNNSQELIDLKNEYRKETSEARKSKDIYNEQLRQIKASKLYIKNYLETEAQKHVTFNARLDDDIKQIERPVEQREKELEKNK